MTTLIPVCVNLALGAMLWLGLCSDWSFTGIWLDMLFPVVAAGLGVLLVIIIIRNKQLSPRKRWLYGLASIPSFGGCLVFCCIAIVTLLPFTYYLTEIADEQFVEQAVSPDGMRTASVYFRPVGAYAAGNGYIIVRVRYRYIPLLERDIYSRTTFEDAKAHFIKWLDNNTILALKRNEVVKVGWIKFQRPWLIGFKGIAFIGVFFLGIITWLIYPFPAVKQ